MIEVTKLKCRGGYRLHAMFYNFTRKQAALKMTPAMAADVTDRVWGMTDLVEMIEAFEDRSH
jgi:hypothetical protein